jgi:cobalt-zinc-cadmium efflux system outer membrane protein
MVIYMKGFLAIGILLFLLFTGSIAFADEPAIQDNSNPPDTLKELIQVAFENNPRIQKSKAQWQAMVEMYPQARSLPDPQLNVNLDLEKGDDGKRDYGVTLMQMIPNPLMLNSKGKKAIRMAEMAQLEYEMTVRDELTGVLDSYYELGYLNTAINITRANQDLFSKLVDLARTSNAASSLPLFELNQAETQKAQSDYELVLLQDLKQVETAKLRKALGVSEDYCIPNIDLPQSDVSDLDLVMLKKSAGEYQQELKMAGVSLEIAQTDVSLARAMSQPEYSIGLMYNSMGMMGIPSDGGDMDGMGAVPMGTSDKSWGFMFGMTLPIWGGKNRAMINEAKANRDAAGENLKAQKLSLDEAIESEYYRIRNLSRLVILYRDTLVPQARNASELAQTQYESGQIPFSQLLETRIVTQNMEIASIRAQADYLKAIAQIARIIGKPVSAQENEVSTPETKEVSK